MKIFVLVIMCLIFINVAISYIAYPTIIPDIELPSYYSNPAYEADMKYHGEPTYYWTLTGSNWCLAGYFEPYKFGFGAIALMINYIGFIGYLSNGPANIYIFLAETNNHPDCTTPDFSKKKYGPYNGHINNSYPNYDDCYVYPYNWYLKKSEIDAQPNKRFWVIYHLPTSPPPYPYSDEGPKSKNCRIYYPGRGWVMDMNGNTGPCWCMHVLVEYPPNAIENTSIGTVKALFR